MRIKDNNEEILEGAIIIEPEIYEINSLENYSFSTIIFIILIVLLMITTTKIHYKKD